MKPTHSRKQKLVLQSYFIKQMLRMNYLKNLCTYRALLKTEINL